MSKKIETCKKTAGELLAEARNIILKRGWTKGDMYSEGSYCALGALHRAGGAKVVRSTSHWDGKAVYTLDETDESTKASRSARRALALAISDIDDSVSKPNDEYGYNNTITTFNDDGDRTKREVLKALDVAIARVEARAASDATRRARASR